MIEMRVLVLVIAGLFASSCAGADPVVEAKAFARTLAMERPKVQWDLSTFVEGDFNGDGRKDVALVGYEGGSILLALRVSSSNRNPRPTQFLPFSISPSIEAAICEAPARLQVEPLICSPMDELLPGCRPSVSARSLWLMGGDCDPINLYWDHDQHRMAWWRL